MPLSELPLEIIEEISYYLSSNDKVVCMRTCQAWYGQFRRTLFRNIYLHNRQRVKKILNLLREDPQMAICVREFRLGRRVGITQAELDELAIMCPYVEAIDFYHWQHLRLDTFTKFQHLKQIPKLINLRRAAQALIHTHRTLSHVEFGEYFLRQMARSNVIMTCICTTKNLTHLTLHGYFNPSGTGDGELFFSQSDWYTLHAELPLLEYIKITTLTLTSQNFDKSDIPLAKLSPRIKTLQLDHLSLQTPSWLPFFTQLYPELEVLDLTFNLNAFVSYNGSRIMLDAVECQQAFIGMFQRLNCLRVLNLSHLRGSHFPAVACFQSSARCKLKQIGIKYDVNLTPTKGFNQPSLEALVESQKETVKQLTIDIWPDAYETFRTFLGPLKQCEKLTTLVLASDNLVAFNYNPIPIDLILDYCPKLKRLDMLRTSLEIDDKHSANHTHPLEHLSLSVSRISEAIFRYLAKRCPELAELNIATCSWMPRKLNMKIIMPNHAFRKIRVSDINKLNVMRLEGDLGHGTSANLFSVRQYDVIKKEQERYRRAHMDHIPSAEELTRWYHLYENDDGRLRYPPSNIRRLFQEEVNILHTYLDLRKQHYVPDRWSSNGYIVDRYVSKKAWLDDIDYGFVTIECKSVDTIIYNFNHVT